MTEEQNVEEKESKIESINITEFKEDDEPIFSSSGVSRVKVTKNGIVKIINVPIQSTGVSELVDTFREKTPLPPKKQTWVDPESELGKELSITKKTGIWAYDYTDQPYIKAKEKHESDLGMAILLKGLAVEIKDKDGNIITDRNRQIEVLKKRGLSGDQFSQIIQDIQALTAWTEEEKHNFLD